MLQSRRIQTNIILEHDIPKIFSSEFCHVTQNKPYIALWKARRRHFTGENWILLNTAHMYENQYNARPGTHSWIVERTSLLGGLQVIVFGSNPHHIAFSIFIFFIKVQRKKNWILVLLWSFVCNDGAAQHMTIMPSPTSVQLAALATRSLPAVCLEMGGGAEYS